MCPATLSCTVDHLKWLLPEFSGFRAAGMAEAGRKLDRVLAYHHSRIAAYFEGHRPASQPVELHLSAPTTSVVAGRPQHAVLRPSALPLPYPFTRPVLESFGVGRAGLPASNPFGDFFSSSHGRAAGHTRLPRHQQSGSHRVVVLRRPAHCQFDNARRGVVGPCPPSVLCERDEWEADGQDGQDEPAGSGRSTGAGFRFLRVPGGEPGRASVDQHHIAGQIEWYRLGSRPAESWTDRWTDSGHLRNANHRPVSMLPVLIETSPDAR